MRKSQAERSEATRGELLRVARELFTDVGYADASIEDVSERAGVTKGALYHHFRNKLDLFQAVFEELEKELVEKTVIAASAAKDDHWEAMRLGVRAFLEACQDPAARRIVLIDGPSVLGWEKWREIDARYGYAVTAGALEAAMGSGVITKRPVEPLAHIFLAALSEAALQIARSDDRASAMEEMFSTLWTLLESLRV